jgi:hypothetical protein
MSRESSAASQSSTPLAALRRFARPAAAVERCELCSAALAPDHQHLVAPANRQLLCACDPCAILFSSQGGTKYRRVPRRVRFLTDLRLSDAQWDSLLIPIGLAFFFHSSSTKKVVAIYPSPAGPTESLLDLSAGEDLVRDNPILKEMEPDTEALLVNRGGNLRAYYLVPIDECYKLVGLIRAHWRGLSGGTVVRAEIDQFFATLQKRSGSR